MVVYKKKLENFKIQPQKSNMWCWSAVAASVYQYYWNNSTWTQCKIVNAVLNRNDCCRNGDSTKCNQGQPMEKAFQQTENLKSSTRSPDPAASETECIEIVKKVCSEIDSGSPVVAKIEYRQGGSHVLVIRGYLIKGDGNKLSDYFFDLADSFYALYSQWPVSDFLSPEFLYEEGRWTESYFTTQI